MMSSTGILMSFIVSFQARQMNADLSCRGRNYPEYPALSAQRIGIAHARPIRPGDGVAYGISDRSAARPPLSKPSMEMSSSKVSHRITRKKPA